jgi:outer membrane protein TolC
VHGPDGTRNLGYSATATLDIPVWDWFATHDRIKQKTALRDSARVTLTTTQRRLVADLDEYYGEATVAHDQLQSLDVSAATARESLRLIRLRYTAGEGTVLEVVDAQNSLVAAENAREDGILRYQTAMANLQILTGTM